MKKTYYSKDEDNFSSHESRILGSFVSNMKSNFEYKHSGDWPQNRIRSFGKVEKEYMELFMTKHTKDLNVVKVVKEP